MSADCIQMENNPTAPARILLHTSQTTLTRVRTVLPHPKQKIVNNTFVRSIWVWNLRLLTHGYKKIGIIAAELTAVFKNWRTIKSDSSRVNLWKPFTVDVNVDKSLIASKFQVCCFTAIIVNIALYLLCCCTTNEVCEAYCKSYNVKKNSAQKM